MTTVLATANSSLPKISYLKSIDIFLVTCFVMVFVSLLEYACVNYLGRRKSAPAGRKGAKDGGPRSTSRRLSSAVRRERIASVPDEAYSWSKTGRECLPLCDRMTWKWAPPDVQERSRSQVNDAVPSNFFGETEVNKDATVRLRSTRCSSSIVSQTAPHVDSAEVPRHRPGRTCPVHPGRVRPDAAKSPPVVTAEKPAGVTPPMSRSAAIADAIDRYSRVFFPLSFVAFNVVYWTIYLTISHKPPEADVVYIS